MDDRLATGATAKAALTAIRQRGAVRVILAVPVAPKSALAEMQDHADEIVCLIPAKQFWRVGFFYRDFHPPYGLSIRAVEIPPLGLNGDLRVPTAPRGIVLFAHGGGSSRLSPRNIAAAEALNERGFATLLMDLLTDAEARDRRNVFDIPLLAERLLEAAL